MDEILIAWKKNLNEKDIVTKTSSDTTEVLKTTKGNSTYKIKIIANKNVIIIDGLNFLIDLNDITKTFSKHFDCSVEIKLFQNTEAVLYKVIGLLN